MVPDLQLLRHEHVAAVLEFELTNREYFTRTISDRGDDYFAHFAERLDALIAEQPEGLGAYYVLVEDGRVLGRFNLILDPDGVATLGYRMAESETGRGLATSAVRELCRFAAARHGVRTVRAAIADTNPASRRVLEKSGFQRAEAADPSDIGGKTGWWYQQALSPDRFARDS